MQDYQNIPSEKCPFTCFSIAMNDLLKPSLPSTRMSTFAVDAPAARRLDDDQKMMHCMPLGLDDAGFLYIFIICLVLDSRVLENPKEAISKRVLQ